MRNCPNKSLDFTDEQPTLVEVMAWCRQARFVLFSTINVYHHFHNRPLPNEQFIMNCIPETGNRFDINAMLVVAPPLHEVPVELRDAITRPPPRLQHVRDIVSRPIGRVPRHLSLFYSSSLTDHHALKIESFFTGTVIHDGPGVGGPKL